MLRAVDGGIVVSRLLLTSAVSLYSALPLTSLNAGY